MMKTMLGYWILILACSTRLQAEEQEIPQNILNTMLQSYTAVRPNFGGDAVNVDIGVYINSILLDDKKMEYEMSFYLREAWTDDRLTFTSEQFDKIDVQDRDILKKIWTPDIFFRSDVSTSVATQEMGHYLMRVSQTGGMWYVRKLHSRQKCPMNLRKFPFDQQWCPIRFESFGYTTKDMQLSFLNDSLDVDGDVQSTLERYSLNDHKTSDCSQNYTAGAFPCLMISMSLRRDAGYFILQLYLPSLLLVALSWLSFWISVRSTTPRLALLLTMTLALLVLCYVTKADLPKVSYATGLDVWNIACVMLVLLALVEFLLVYCLDTYCTECGKEDAAATGSAEAPPAAAEKASPMDKVSRPFRPPGAPRCEVIDRCCRLVFPLLFLLFNIIYWSVITCRD